MVVDRFIGLVHDLYEVSITSQDNNIIIDKRISIPLREYNVVHILNNTRFVGEKELELLDLCLDFASTPVNKRIRALEIEGGTSW